MRRFELAQRLPRHRDVADREGTAGPRRREKGPRLVRQPIIRLVDAAQPQHPVFEVPRQRLNRDADRDRLDHRRAEPEQRLVRVVLLRPLVDQFSEIADVPERLAVDRRQRRPQRLHVVQAHQVAALALHIADASVRERLEARAEAPPALTRVFRDAALLPAIARQEDNDEIRFTELVGPQNQRVGGMERHPEADYNSTSARYRSGSHRPRATRTSHGRAGRGRRGCRRTSPGLRARPCRCA